MNKIKVAVYCDFANIKNQKIDFGGVEQPVNLGCRP